MNYLEFKKSVFDISLEMGCEAAELYKTDEESFSVDILEKEIDSYSVSSSGGVNLRVVLGGKNGFAYTQQYTDPRSLVERAVDNARVIENEDERPLQGPCEYQEIENPKSPAKDMSEKELIEMALKLEEAARNADERFERVTRSTVAKQKTKIELSNTLGLDAKFEKDSCATVLGIVLKQGEEIENGYAVRYYDEFEDIKAVVDEAVAYTASKFNASPVKSGEYKVIIKNEAATSLFSAFSPLFSAELAQKKMSLLEGKEGEKIASSCLSIIDDGLFYKNPRPFDGEGVPSQTTTLLENGVLKTLLHDLKTAKKAGVKSTSNGARGGGGVGVKCSNFIICEGNVSFADLEETMQNGLVINSVSGLHAGLSIISGDFSLIADGYLVENGKKVKAVKQITIAGNFLKFMEDIDTIANDTYFDYLGSSMCAAPSFLVSKLMVSGT